MIKIDFEKSKDGYTFKDALWLPDNHTYTDAELEAMKQQRFDTWYDLVTNPPVETQEPGTPIPDTIIEEQPQE